MIARLATAVFTGFPPRRIVMVFSLTAAWCVLWGTLSVANLLSGVVVAVVVTAAGLGGALPGGIRPFPLVRLLWLVLVDLVISTIKVGREVLTRDNHMSESIVAVTVRREAARHMLFYTAAITLTPGTTVVDTDMESGTLFVHLLHDDEMDATATHIQRLAELAVQAFPIGDATATPTPSGDLS